MAAHRQGVFMKSRRGLWEGGVRGIAMGRCLGRWACTVGLLLAGAGAQAWDENGHRAVALMAQARLAPDVVRQVEALLAMDDSGLASGVTLADHAAWADRWRDSDRRSGQQRYRATRRWHYVNLPIHGRDDLDDLRRVCPTLTAQDPAPLGQKGPSSPEIDASRGPAETCIVERVEAFAAEVADDRRPALERARALQFLVHLVADLHQPLHVGDDGDHGGNDRSVSLPRRASSVSLHAFWDHDAVRLLASRPERVVRRVEQGSGPPVEALGGSARRWALETRAVARDVVYARLPAPQADGSVALEAEDLQALRPVVALQLRRAGERLAAILNRALSRH